MFKQVKEIGRKSTNSKISRIPSEKIKRLLLSVKNDARCGQKANRTVEEKDLEGQRP